MLSIFSQVAKFKKQVCFFSFLFRAFFHLLCFFLRVDISVMFKVATLGEEPSWEWSPAGTVPPLLRALSLAVTLSHRYQRSLSESGLQQRQPHSCLVLPKQSPGPCCDPEPQISSKQSLLCHQTPRHSGFSHTPILAQKALSCSIAPLRAALIISFDLILLIKIMS